MWTWRSLTTHVKPVLVSLINFIYSFVYFLWCFCYLLLAIIIIYWNYEWCEFVVCLDGSLPAYHLDRGFGAGEDNWLLQFEVYSYFSHCSVQVILNDMTSDNYMIWNDILMFWRILSKLLRRTIFFWITRFESTISSLFLMTKNVNQNCIKL